MSSDKTFPSSFDDVAQFNEGLVKWLAGSSPGATLGGDHAEVVATVTIAGHACYLRGGSTRKGVGEYLARTMRGGGFSVVGSTKGVVHRVTPGVTSQRIQEFYLYTATKFDEPQRLSSAEEDFGVVDFLLRVLEAVTLLHAEGHQRLRVWVFPNDLGPRLHIYLAEDFTDGGPDPISAGREPVYRWDGPFSVHGTHVGPSTPVQQIARAIVARARDKGLGIDWPYAGWFAELVSAALGLRQLPYGYAMSSHDWMFSPSGIPFPPPPGVRRERTGFEDAFPKIRTAESLVPFTAPYPAEGPDVTKQQGFRGTFACFQGIDEPLMGLFAFVGDDAYRRVGRAWHPVSVSLSELQARASCEVNYRFIRAVDRLEVSHQKPSWELAQQMRVGG